MGNPLLVSTPGTDNSRLWTNTERERERERESERKRETERGEGRNIDVYRGIFLLAAVFPRRPSHPSFILTLDITVFRGTNRGQERLTAESSGGTSKSFFDAIQQILTLAN